MDFFDPSAALYGAPDLVNSPSLALAAGGDPNDPVGAGEVVSHAASTVALQKAATDMANTHGDEFVHHVFRSVGHFIGSVKDVAGGALTQLSRPLHDVQHDYRYIKDVYARHGWKAGVAEQLGMLAAGAAGTILSGGNIAVGIGAADAVASFEQRHFFKDSSERTADGENYRLNGHLVSPGRDFANTLGLHDTDHGFGKLLSGGVDTAFDFQADPLVIGGKINAARKSVQGFTKLPMYNRIGAVTKFVDRFAPGTGIGLANVDRIDHARIAYGGYGRALEDIAGSNSGDIIAKYGTDLQGLAKDLGAADSADKVHEVFRQAAFDANFNGQISGAALPMRSVIRTPFTKAYEALRNVGGETALTDRQGILGALDTSVLHPTQARRALAGAVAKKVQTFTGTMPYAIDKETLDLSTHTFDPDSSTGWQGVYRSLKFAMGETAARRWTARFIDADNLAEKKAIWTEAQAEMFKAAGLDSEHIENLKAVREIASGRVAGEASGDHYGQGLLTKDDVNDVIHAGGTDRLGIYAHQTGDFAYPDFFQLRGAVRDMNRYSRIYGKLDDFAADHFTNKYFKPLALVTMGFGLRVAASEAIPGVMRYGALNMLRGAAASTAARVKYDLDTRATAARDFYGDAARQKLLADTATAAGDTVKAATHQARVDELTKLGDNSEHGHVISAAASLVGGMGRLLSSETDRDLAMQVVLRNEGQFVKGVASTGENNSVAPIDRTERTKSDLWYVRQRQGRVAMQEDKKSFQTLDRNEDQFQSSWVAALQRRSREASGQQIATDLRDAYRRGLSPLDAHAEAVQKETDRIRMGGHPDDPYAAERDKLARYDKQTPQDFAFDRVDDMANHLTGDDGTFHDGLARMIANGHKPTLEDVNRIDYASRPGIVVGHKTVPHVGDSLLQRGVNEGFKRLVDPMINHISREPIFFNAVKSNYQRLEEGVRQGMLTQEEAVTRAMYRGALDMMPQIHNTALRSQFAQLARNFLPFYFAQEQALKRAGKLVGERPEALEKYLLIEHGLNDPSFVHTDADGNRSLMIPLVGPMAGHLLSALDAAGLPTVGGLPISVSGNMQSLQTVLPEANQPGVSPLVSVSLNSIAKLFPEWTPEVKMLVGQQSANRTLLDQMIPNSLLRNAVRGFRADETDASFSSAFTAALMSAAYHGHLPPANATEAEQQAFLDRVKNNTRSMFWLKALISLVSPLSPNVTQGDPALSDEWKKLVRAKGPDGKKVPYSEAIQEFVARHGDKAMSYTVAKSKSTSDGAQIPYANDAIDWVNANHGLVGNKDYALAASYLAPQGGTAGDGHAIYDELLRMNLRARRTPEDFRNAVYIMQGNRQFYADFDAHDKYMKALPDPNGPEADAERKQWDAHLRDLKNANRIWAHDFDSGKDVDNAKAAFDQMSHIFDKGLAPAGPQTDLVRGLFNDYNTHSEALAAMGTNRSMAKQRQAERDSWSKYLDARAEAEPRLDAVIKGVFKPMLRNF